MTKDEALKLALDVFGGNDWHEEIVDLAWADKANTAITAIKEALAQPEQICGLDVVLDESMPPNTFKLAQPEHSPNCALLKIPSKDCDCQDQQEPVIDKSAAVRIATALGWEPKRKPLTDEEIMEMYNEPRSDAEMLEFARAIEAAHGIKGDA